MRRYCQVATSLWRDAKWRALPRRAQWTYLMLISQADISAAGVLGLLPGRWLAYAPDRDRDELAAALDELAAAHFLVVDEDTCEVLVRSFIRWDGGINNVKRRQVIRAAVNAVSSSKLRHVLAYELDRLGVSGWVIPPPGDAPSPDTRDSPSDSPSDGASDGASRSGKDGLSRSGEDGLCRSGKDQPTTHNPQPTTQKHFRSPRSRRAREQVEASFDRFWMSYPRRVAKGAARRAWAKAITKVDDPKVIVDAAAKFADDPGCEPKFVPYPATWLNGERWADAPPPPSMTSGYRPFVNPVDVESAYGGVL